jgi:hypothetical protein
MQKAIVVFTNSAGAFLLAMGMALFVINWTSPADYVPPHDPILLLSVRDLFWIIGAIAAVAALMCFFSDRQTMSSGMLLWFAISYLVYRIGFSFDGCPDLTGYLGGFAAAFGIAAKVADRILEIGFLYLLVGSMASLVWLWLKGEKSPPRRTSTASRTEAWMPQPYGSATTPENVPAQPVFVRFLKIPCTTCGGRIEFPSNLFGEIIPCPHCKMPVTLQKPASLKMSCGFCQGHIEFPDYAEGEKTPCPYCKKEITLTRDATI